jgi:uncharacterized NAD(P)/FAD-binding protein YdhS
MFPARFTRLIHPQLKRSFASTVLAPYTVAVIGGGPAGTMTILNLLEKKKTLSPATPLAIQWIKDDDGTPFGPGKVFAIEDTFSGMPNAHSKSRRMSLLESNPNHFVDWLQKNKRTLVRNFPAMTDVIDNPNQAVTRHIYGLYILDTLEKTFAVLPPHVTVNKITAKAINIVPQNDGREAVLMQNDTVVVADAVVMGLGLPVKRVPALKPLYDADNSPVSGYIISTGLFAHKDDVSGQTLDDIPASSPEANVVIVGSGIAAAGVIKRLYNKGFQGRISIISLCNRFPHVSDSERDYQLKLFTDDNLPKTAKEAYALYAKEYALAKKDGYKWYDVLDAINQSFANKIWENFPPAEKALYRRNYAMQHLNATARISPNIQLGINDFREKGRLSIIQGKICHAGKSPNGGFQLQVQRPRGNLQDFEFSHVINCVGLENNIYNSENPLIEQLLRDNRVRPSEFNLGMDVLHNARLYCVGPSAQGSKILSAATVPTIRPTAANVAHRLVENMQSHEPGQGRGR